MKAQLAVLLVLGSVSFLSPIAQAQEREKSLQLSELLVSGQDQDGDSRQYLLPIMVSESEDQNNKAKLRAMIWMCKYDYPKLYEALNLPSVDGELAVQGLPVKEMDKFHTCLNVISNYTKLRAKTAGNKAALYENFLNSMHKVYESLEKKTWALDVNTSKLGGADAQR
jgi:hypothetical protein